MGSQLLLTRNPIRIPVLFALSLEGRIPPRRTKVLMASRARRFPARSRTLSFLTSLLRYFLTSFFQLIFGGKIIFQNCGAGDKNSTGTSDPS